MRVFHSFLFLLAFGSTSLPAQNAPDFTRWTEDFSKAETFAKDWSPYGFLASGISKESPLGKNVSGKDARPEWWQIVEGSLRSRNFPEEKHQAGITRLATGTDIRLSCRVKIPVGGFSQVTIRGNNPIVEKNFHIAVLRLTPTTVAAADNDVIHPKDSPQAAEMKAKGQWNRKFIVPKTEKRATAPDVWHDLILELKGKELTAFIDGEKALTYTTLCGAVAKTSIGLAGGRHPTEIMDVWYDDVRFEPLEMSSSKQ